MKAMLNGTVSSILCGGQRLTLTQENHNLLANGLSLTLDLQFPTEDAVYGRLYLKNDGSTPTAQITAPKSLDLTLSTGDSNVIWNGIAGDSCAGDSFLPQSKVLKNGDCHHLAPTDGRPSNISAFPFFDFVCNGAAYGVGIGWSGQWTSDLSVKNGSLNLQVGLAEEINFHLLPGEGVALPSFLLVKSTDTKSLYVRFRAIMGEYFSPRTRIPDLELPISVQPFDRYFYGKCPKWETYEGQLETIEAAAKIGSFDTYWLDAAWFKAGFPSGVGNYTFEKGFPDGLKPISDAAHAHGMEFVVWHEPERVVSVSDTGLEHPEFLFFPETPDNAGFYNCLFNLGDDRARCWLADTLISFIRDNGMDKLRIDYNIEPLPYWRRADTEGRIGITEIRCVNGLYKLWDAIIEAYPTIFIDNCASGGRRIDLETCRRAVPMWRSDTGCFPTSEAWRNQTWNQNQILSLNRYLPYHAGGVWETEVYDLRAAQSGGVACNFNFLNPQPDTESLGKIMAEIKRLRHWWNKDFFPLGESTLDETCWIGYGFVHNGSGVCWLFRRDEAREAERVYSLPADPDAMYTLTITDEQMVQTTETVSGKALCEGYSFRIPDSRASLVAEFTKI